MGLTRGKRRRRRTGPGVPGRNQSEGEGPEAGTTQLVWRMRSGHQEEVRSQRPRSLKKKAESQVLTPPLWLL